MKKNYLFLFIILILCSLNIYLCFNFKSFKDNAAKNLKIAENNNERIIMLQTSIEASVQNAGLSIKNTILKDSFNQKQRLSDVKVVNKLKFLI